MQQYSSDAVVSSDVGVYHEANVMSCPAAIPVAGAANRTSGDHSEGVTPDPIPNSAVKPFSADGTTRANVWESRTLPDL